MFKRARAAVRVLQGESVRSVPESLSPDLFTFAKTVRHGFLHEPCVIAVDPVQQLVAVGNHSGGIKFYGRTGTEHHVQHHNACSVMSLVFLVNEGALISVTSDNTVHMWNLRQKIPAVVQSLNFTDKGSSGGKITCCYVPLQSTWLYIGTDGGNVFTVSISSFMVSFYTIYWNHVIGGGSRVRPGSVQFLLESPDDDNKMLIVYEQLVALWDLRAKATLFRKKLDQRPTGAAWLGDGKIFAIATQDGAVQTFNARDGDMHSVIVPASDTSTDSITPARHLHWLSTKEEPVVIYTGGSASDVAAHTVTVRRGGDDVKAVNFPSLVVGLVCLTHSPHASEVQDPHTLIVLLEDRLEVLDLNTPSLLPFHVPFVTNIHHSPVTCIRYEADVPPTILESLQAIGHQQRSVGSHSLKHWPLTGGAPSQFMTDFCDVIVTGHADGSVKFWDASQVVLTSLYTLQSSDLFEKTEDHSPTSSGEPGMMSKQQSLLSHSSGTASDLPPMAITTMQFSGESSSLAIGNSAGLVLLFKFSSKEMDIVMQDLRVSAATNDLMVRRSNSSGLVMRPEEQADGSKPPRQPSPSELVNGHITLPWLQCRRGKFRQRKGFQANVCLTCSSPGEDAVIYSVEYLESFGLLAVTTSRSLVLADVLQQKLLLNRPVEYLAEHINQMCVERKRSQTVSAGSPVTPGRKMPRLPTVRRSNKPPLSQTSADGSGSTPPLAGGKRRGIHFPKRKISSTDQSPMDESPTSLPSSISEESSTTVTDGKHGKAKGFLAEIKRKQSSNKVELSPNIERSSPGNNVSGDELEDEPAEKLPLLDHETAMCMQFAVTYSVKDDYHLYPSLWLGSSSGSVICLSLSIPPPQSRGIQEVSWESRAVVLRVSSKTAITTLAVLDEEGRVPLIPSAPYSESQYSGKTTSLPVPGERKQKTSIGSRASVGEGPSAASHFLVAASDTTVYVYSLPSHGREKAHIREGTTALRSAVVSVGDDSVFTSLTADGHLVVYALPSLKKQLDVEVSSGPPPSCMSDTQSWTSDGQGLYMSSASEIQRFSILKDNFLNLPDSLPDLYTVRSLPDRPQKGFFANLMGGSKKLDREALFGSNMGEGNQVVATRINSLSGMDAVCLKTGEAVNVFEKARDALIERGEKLSQVEKRTADMAANASDFASTARALVEKLQ